ncbi:MULTISPECIES: FMN-dependent NADH-azoreductase [Pseudomonas]|uniref:FMN-dependent NADH-azoreductase n=1 Tax=Pseudomonas TaxID=286 RepID=UPI00087D279A|nr:MULTISPECIES: NAD(P)H-dependent oxidoreductase [Pseudomonas]KAB0514183.1 FMN-dependent NADH-azoreductase [Pseudomonas koreensis]NNA62606.1 FMN-dependent NADH-azoreductase [Pseudomonas koreensis]PWK45940.1 FMN-dependent NADH-azoreductase [Pseudomonas sp. OV226]SDC60482.1 FMN-dependent NADH-azoreductase [Pseudomonas koreensis]GGK48008.1 FMN-dependent NADH-azoreductase [Pseudomonas koreensis]
MQILHLDSSILGAASVSRQLSSNIVGRLKALHPDSNVIYRDLALDPALHLSGKHLAAWQGAGSDDAMLTEDLYKGTAYLQELLESDVVVIGTPMYNLTIPTPLKAWIDRISLVGKTFQYTDKGPAGLLKNKQAYIASSRGGVYSSGSPAAPLEHQETYLIGLLGFLGISDTKVIRAEGLAINAQVKDAAIAKALEDIAAITG